MEESDARRVRRLDGAALEIIFESPRSTALRLARKAVKDGALTKVGKFWWGRAEDVQQWMLGRFARDDRSQGGKTGGEK